MMTIREYKQAESLEEAWQLNQKKANRVLGGMIWLKMENINVGTAIDLSGLGLDTIEETEDTAFPLVPWLHCASWKSTRSCCVYPWRSKGSAAAYRGRAAAQSGNCGWQHLQPVRLFRCAHAVYGHGLFGRVVQGWDHIPAGSMLSALMTGTSLCG